MVGITVGHGVKVELVNSSDVEIGTAASPLIVSGTETAPSATILTTSQVTVSATEVLILASDATRLGATLVNTGSVNMYFGPTGITAINSLIIPPGTAYNVDFPNYTGAIYGLAASGNPVVARAVLT